MDDDDRRRPTSEGTHARTQSDCRSLILWKVSIRYGNVDTVPRTTCIMSPNPGTWLHPVMIVTYPKVCALARATAPRSLLTAPTFAFFCGLIILASSSLARAFFLASRLI